MGAIDTSIERVGDGTTEGAWDDLCVGSKVEIGMELGAYDEDSLILGGNEGILLGTKLGSKDGLKLGAKEGTPLGTGPGLKDGPILGVIDGIPLGRALGAKDGVSLGKELGATEGVSMLGWELGA